jgi:hypothetical protein
MLRLINTNRSIKNFGLTSSDISKVWRDGNRFWLHPCFLNNSSHIQESPSACQGTQVLPLTAATTNCPSSVVFTSSRSLFLDNVSNCKVSVSAGWCKERGIITIIHEIPVRPYLLSLSIHHSCKVHILHTVSETTIWLHFFKLAQSWYFSKNSYTKTPTNIRSCSNKSFLQYATCYSFIAVTISTTYCNIQYLAFCPHSVFMCSVWFSQ